MSAENSTERQPSKEAQDLIDAWANKCALSLNSPDVQEMVSLIIQMEQYGATLEKIGKVRLIFNLRRRELPQ